MDYNELLADYDDVLLPEDIKKILKTGMNTVYALLSTGRIKSIRLGKSRGYRIPKPYLIEYLKDNNNSSEH